jgi:uncharacterized protein YbjT (DUF2867 family)
VTIISRNPDKVGDLVGRGARLVKGEIDDQAVLDEALKGADALFWLTPPAGRPDYHDWAVATARKAATTAKRLGVSRVAILSSVGAQTGRGTGPVAPMLEIEGLFAQNVPNTVSLRAGFFMENLFRSLDTLAQGAIYQPTPASVPFPMVATRDIAAVAAKELLDQSWTGHRIRGVHGPEHLTYNQVAAILSDVLGRPIQYVQVSVDQARQGMRAAGLPDFLTDTFSEMYQAIVDGRMAAAEPRSPETTTPTSLAQFAREALVPALSQARAN